MNSKARWICVLVTSKIEKFIELFKNLPIVEDYKYIHIPENQTKKSTEIRDINYKYLFVKVIPTQKNLKSINDLPGVFRILGKVTAGFIKPILHDLDNFPTEKDVVHQQEQSDGKSFSKDAGISIGDTVTLIKGIFPGTGVVLEKNNDYYLVSLMLSDKTSINLEVTEDFIRKSDI